MYKFDLKHRNLIFKPILTIFSCISFNVKVTELLIASLIFRFFQDTRACVYVSTLQDIAMALSNRSERHTVK